jgi:hypothetical protein
VGKFVHERVEVGLGALIRVLGGVCNLAGDGVLAAIVYAAQKQEWIIEILCLLSQPGPQRHRGTGVFQHWRCTGQTLSLGEAVVVALPMAVNTDESLGGCQLQ